MAKGIKPETPNRDTAESQQVQGYHSEDLEIRRQKLDADLRRKGVFDKPDPKFEGQGAKQGAAQAIKLSSEFLAGIVVGIVLGLGFDKLVGASPWGLIVCLFLGFAAGVLNVLRSVGRVAPSQLGQRSVLRKDNKADKPE